MNDYYVIYNRLEKLRGMYGYTQEYLVEVGDISIQTYQMMKKRGRLPAVHFWVNLYKIGIDIDYVLIGKKSRKSIFCDYFKELTKSQIFEIHNIMLNRMKSEDKCLEASKKHTLSYMNRGLKSIHMNV